jgi:DNA-directed RNA polymerase beta' subunit
MADQLRRPEAVSREVTALSFGFFTASEARRVSVKRITATEVLDRLDNAVPDGLYDPALGPTDPKGTAHSRHAAWATPHARAHHCLLL